MNSLAPRRHLIHTFLLEKSCWPVFFWTHVDLQSGEAPVLWKVYQDEAAWCLISCRHDHRVHPHNPQRPWHSSRVYHPTMTSCSPQNHPLHDSTSQEGRVSGEFRDWLVSSNMSIVSPTWVKQALYNVTLTYTPQGIHVLLVFKYIQSIFGAFLQSVSRLSNWLVFGDVKSSTDHLVCCVCQHISR